MMIIDCRINVSKNLQILQEHRSSMTPVSNLVFSIWPNFPVELVSQVLVETFEGYSFHRLMFPGYTYTGIDQTQHFTYGTDLVAVDQWMIPSIGDLTLHIIPCMKY